jgi:hypothetical protein
MDARQGSDDLRLQNARTSRAAKASILGVIGVILALVPYAGATGVESLDRILFSPLAVLFAAGGVVCSVVAVRIGLRERDRFVSKLAVACGILGILIAVAAFFI